MRRFVLTIAAVLLVAGCSSGQRDVTCAELDGDAEASRRMTDALVAVTQEDRDLAEAMWATLCANAHEHERARATPYRQALELLWEH